MKREGNGRGFVAADEVTELPDTVPVSVKSLRDGVVKIRCTGSDVFENETVPKSF